MFKLCSCLGGCVAFAGAFEGKGVARVDDDQVDKMSSAMQEARARTEAQRKER